MEFRVCTGMTTFFGVYARLALADAKRHRRQAVAAGTWRFPRARQKFLSLQSAQGSAGPPRPRSVGIGHAFRCLVLFVRATCCPCWGCSRVSWAATQLVPSSLGRWIARHGSPTWRLLLRVSPSRLPAAIRHVSQQQVPATAARCTVQRARPAITAASGRLPAGFRKSWNKRLGTYAP